MPEYRSIYNMPFDVEESILEDLKKELESYGVPSISKIGVGVSFARSLPYTNGNGLGLTARCIKNSLDTGRLSKFDIHHDQADIVGTMINLKVYDDTDEIIPEKPMRVFGIGALYRNRLRDHDILPKELTEWGTSLEVLFADFDFWHKGKVVLKEDADIDWLMHVDDIIQGIPYFSGNARVCIIAGGIDDDAFVDFNGNALTKIPADSEAGILLAVAEKKQSIFDDQGGNQSMNFTQEQMDQALAELREQMQAEFDTKFSEVNVQFEQANASLTDRDTQLQELQTKLAEAEAKVTEFEAKATAAEAELQKQAIAKLVEDRKQALSAINYPSDLIESKVEFMSQASEEDFVKFIDEFKVIAASLATKQVTASKKEVKEIVPNLTVGDKDKKVDIGLMI